MIKNPLMEKYFNSLMYLRRTVVVKVNSLDEAKFFVWCMNNRYPYNLN